jgi:phosphatidate cytidylyltransferase
VRKATARRDPTKTMTRWITGLPLAVLVVLLILYAPFWACLVVVVAVAVLCGVEFISLVVPGATKSDKILCSFFCALHTVLIVFVVVLPQVIVAGHDTAIKSLEASRFCILSEILFLFLMVFVVFSVSLSLRRDLLMSLNRLGPLVFAVLYIGVPLGLLSILLMLERPLVFWILAVTFLADTVAYLVGKAWGRQKMALRISPGKTWEGFGGSLLGGFVASIVVILIFLKTSWHDLGLPVILGFGFMGAFVAVFGVLGDLSESFLKRAVGVKDSGKLIPGHGGILDRLDGLLFTTPVTFAVFSLAPIFSESVRDVFLKM